MPFTPDMRRRVDQIRDYLYGGGYPDPLSNAEQFSFLFFFYMIEGIDAANLRQAKATSRDYTSLFAGEWTLRNPLNAPAKGVESIPRARDALVDLGQRQCSSSVGGHHARSRAVSIEGKE